ncbi:hypothetical protein [Pseudomonas arsenicoxydans]|nr:hypothetical protein [Pseudomonas arsenicoxydans]
MANTSLLKAPTSRLPKVIIKSVGNDLHIATEGISPDQPQLILEVFF